MENVGFELFTGSLRDGRCLVRDMFGRIIASSERTPIAWGPDAAFHERYNLAVVLLFYSEIRGPHGELAQAMAADVVPRFDLNGWSMTSDQVHQWVQEVRGDGKTRAQ